MKSVAGSGYSSRSSLRSSSAGRSCTFSISTRAQVFQRRIASSFPAGLIASACEYQCIARRKPSYASWGPSGPPDSSLARARRSSTMPA